MSRTGLEDAYIMRGSKKLRMGYTTGSCAAAAARGAAFMLLSGKEIQEVKIHTPKGIVLNLELLDIRRSAEKVSCAVRKDGGDDPDVTDKALIYAEVTFGTEEGIVIDGGFGVGRVTKPGLDQPVGNAAINHVPRQMIRENVEEIQKKLDDFRALQVIISVPEGEELAKHTFNPRLGITGGISILGTSGIVVPMSEEALISTIRVEMEMRKAQGDRVLLVTPGNYGQDFLKTYPWVRADHSVKCSNYVGKTLEFAAELGFDAILFVAHLGKFVKVSGGIMNTHSHEADCRAELLTAQAVRAGADLALTKKLLETGTTEEAVQILKEAGCLKETMEKVTEKIAFYMNYHIEGRVQTEAIVFSSNEGLLGETPGAGELLERLREQDLAYPLFTLGRNAVHTTKQFKNTPGGVLLATGAAWEGFDFPGDCVSLLVIPRLPFPIPDALKEKEREQYPTLHSFLRGIVVPEMQIKLKQGFGRAIRLETDTCVVAILDERAARDQRYWKDILAALPEMPVTQDIHRVEAFIRSVKPDSYFQEGAA